MGVLGYLPKLKRGLGLAFGVYFMHDFSIKIFLISYYIYGQSFNVIPFSFSRYQTKCVIKFLLLTWNNICNLIGWEECNTGRICTLFSIFVLCLNKKKTNKKKHDIWFSYWKNGNVFFKNKLVVNYLSNISYIYIYIDRQIINRSTFIIVFS